MHKEKTEVVDGKVPIMEADCSCDEGYNRESGGLSVKSCWLSTAVCSFLKALNNYLQPKKLKIEINRNMYVPIIFAQ